MDNSELPVVHKVAPELNEELLKDFTGERTEFIQVGPQKFLFPVKFETILKDVIHFQVRPDDTWICTFPRSGWQTNPQAPHFIKWFPETVSGTTVTQEMVYLLQTNLDYEGASKELLDNRVPFFESDMMVHDDIWNEILEDNKHSPENLELLNAMGNALPDWKALASAPSPRFIKTHLPLHLLPKNLLTSGAKVIYIARNPKDVAVSWYHMNRLARYQGFIRDFPKFWDYFERDLTTWSPYFEHVKEGWSKRHEPNLLFIFYEDINKKLRDTIQKVANFLNKPLNENQLDKLENHLKFENFKNNPAVNDRTEVDLKILLSKEQSFVRKGKVGGWIDEFTPELSNRADKWINENLSKTDLRFPV